MDQGRWKALDAKPFAKGGLESQVVSGFSGVKGAVHVGVEKNAKVSWELKVAEGEDVMPVCGGMVGINEERLEMLSCARKVQWIWWGK